MQKEQLYRIKNATIYFVMIGLIASYVIVTVGIELDIFKDNIASVDNFRFELFGIFITIQLILMFAKLVVNRNHGLISLENIGLLSFFALEITIIYSSVFNGIGELYGIGTHIAIMIIEVVKAFTLLTYAVTNILDNFYTGNNNKFFNNNIIGVSND
ncbi:MAG: hypothetical protein R2863_10305 [Candidatus Kapaibacterium sp.]|nr:hypothetical protein [Ignavibacteriota bacterium]